MKRSLSILCALSLAVVVFASGENSKSAQPELRLSPAPESENCKPEAPIRVDLAPRDLVGGRARLDYTVTPIMDAIAIDVSIGFPQGGNLRWHNEPSRAAALPKEARNGSLSVELPVDLPGVEVQVNAHITILDPDGIDGMATYTTTRTATWGTVDRIIEGVTEVYADGVLTLDTAATRN